MKKKKRNFWSFVFGAFVLVAIGCLGALWYLNTVGAESDGEGAVVSESASAVASETGFGVKREPVFPDVDTVDRKSFEATSRVAVTSLATWDSREDAGFAEAVERTEPLFDSSLTARVSGVEVQPVSWGEEVVEKEAFSSPHVMDYDIYSDYQNDVQEADSRSRDGKLMRSVSYAVRWDWLGRDGSSWSANGRVRVYELWLVQDVDGQWSVASYAWRDEVSE